MLAHRVVFNGPGDVSVEVEDLPDAGPGEVLTKTIVSLISSGTEMTLLSGEYEPDSFWARYGCYPVTPGFGQVAEVLSVGDGVGGIQTGDLVLTSLGHRSASLLPADKAHRLDVDIFPEEAVFHTIASGVIRAIRKGGVRLGDTVAVVGLGLLGQFAVRLARIAGAHPVIGIDLSATRRDLALSGGATAVAAGDRDSLTDEIRNVTGGDMADVVLEMTGDAHAIPTALGLLRGGGRYVQVGCPRAKTEIAFQEMVVLPEVTIVGALFASQSSDEDHGGAFSHLRATRLYSSLVQEGSLEVASLITHRFSWRAAPDAYRMLAEDRAKSVGVLIDWTD